MSVLQARHALKREDAYTRRRTDLVKRLPQVLGVTPIAAYIPNRTDLTTSICPYSGRVWTAEAAMTLVPQGFGVVRRMVVGSQNYLTTPDTNDLSFGNGAADSPLTLIHYGRPSSVAGNHTIFSKTDGSAAQEYRWLVSGAAAFQFVFLDQSAAAQTVRAADAAVPVDSFNSYATTYDGSGGATAGNGVLMYVNGAAVASTPTNNASYVAMENLTQPGEAGTTSTHTAAFYDGLYGGLLICAGVLSAGVLLSTHYTLRGYFGG